MRIFWVLLCAIRVFQFPLRVAFTWACSKWLGEAQAKHHQTWIKMVSSKISKCVWNKRKFKRKCLLFFWFFLRLCFFFGWVSRWIQMLQKQWRFCLRGSFRRRRLSISWIESCGLEAQNWTWAAGVNLVASHPPWPPAAVTCRSKKRKKKNNFCVPSPLGNVISPTLTFLFRLSRHLKLKDCLELCPF